MIPPGEATTNGELRTVEIGWHPVGGFGGKWFAEKTGLGKMITKEVKKYPDPTQHWAVLVDDYCHELWMVRSALSFSFLLRIAGPDVEMLLRDRMSI